MAYSLAAVVYLAAAGEEPQGIDLVLPDLNELVAGVIAFGLVFLAFWKWVLPLMKKSLDARRDAITGSLQEAESAKVEAETLRADYRQQLSEARGEADRIVDAAKQSAETVRGDILAKAEQEAATITRRAREEAAAEKERAAAGIRDEVALLSLDLAQKAVAGTVDADAQKILVDRYLDELERMT